MGVLAHAARMKVGPQRTTNLDNLERFMLFLRGVRISFSEHLGVCAVIRGEIVAEKAIFSGVFCLG
jgi:hypothetical protein